MHPPQPRRAPARLLQLATGLLILSSYISLSTGVEEASWQTHLDNDLKTRYDGDRGSLRLKVRQMWLCRHRGNNDCGSKDDVASLPPVARRPSLSDWDLSDKDRQALEGKDEDGPPAQSLRLAFASTCLNTGGHGNNFGGFAYYDQCLASICSLIGTSSPQEIVYIIDEHFPAKGRKLLTDMGVKLVMTSPELAVWPDSDRFPASEFRNHPRMHTFQKLLIFNMTDYDRVVWIDSDTEVRKNLTTFFLGLPTSREAVIGPVMGQTYFNSGVMVVTPSHETYNELMDIWREGDFINNIASSKGSPSNVQITEQDLLIEYFLRRHYPYSFHEFGLCSNYRGYLRQYQGCGVSGDEARDSEVLHIAKLVKWVDVSGWIITAWKGECKLHAEYAWGRRKGAI